VMRSVRPRYAASRASHHPGRRDADRGDSRLALVRFRTFSRWRHRTRAPDAPTDARADRAAVNVELRFVELAQCASCPSSVLQYASSAHARRQAITCARTLR